MPVVRRRTPLILFSMTTNIQRLPPIRFLACVALLIILLAMAIYGRASPTPADLTLATTAAEPLSGSPLRESD